MTDKIAAYIETQSEQEFFGGKSDSVEAEYGSSSDSPFTLLEFWNGEPIAIEGYLSQKGLEKALADLRRDGAKVFYV